MTNIDTQLYPFSTGTGHAIPLDVINPSGTISKTLAAGINHIVFPSTMHVASFYSEVDCIIQWGNHAATGGTLVSPPVDGAYYPESLYVPAGVIVVSAIPGIAAIAIKLDIPDSILRVQGIHKWTALVLPRQLNNY